MAWNGVGMAWGWTLTSHGCGAALDGEQHGEHGVGDAVVDHVALPLDLDLAAAPAVDRHAVHDPERDGGAGDLFVGLLVPVRPVAVRLRFAVDGFVPDGDFLQRAKRALERPADQIHAGGAEREVLAAGDGRRGQAGIFTQVFWSHEGHLEVVLDQHSGDEVDLVAVLRVSIFHNIVFASVG